MLEEVEVHDFGWLASAYIFANEWKHQTEQYYPQPNELVKHLHIVQGFLLLLLY